MQWRYKVNFGNDQLVELKSRIEVLIAGSYGPAAGTKLREYFDDALKNMIIERERARVLRELDAILDSEEPA
jgi:hypothetical protein